MASSQDDWEKAYEAERAALASGGNASNNRRRGNNEDDLFAAYYGSSASNQQPDNKTASMATKSDADVFGGGNSSKNNNNNNTNLDTPNETSKGGREETSSHRNAAVSRPSTSYPEDDDARDCRYDIAFEKVPQHLSSTFKERISPYCFFVEPCEFYVRAFFGQNKIPALAIITSHGIHFFEVADGSMIAGMPIRQIGTMFVVGPQGIGLRCANPQNKYDLYVKFPRRREVFVEIVKKLYKKYKADEYGDGGDLYVAEGSDEREKSYRAEVKWLKKGEFLYPIEDDPRSGLELLLVPDQHKAAYAPLVPKILHYFGGVNHISYQPNKVLSPQRRGCWMTPGGIFLCLPAGPGEFGENIRRCVYAENIRSIIVADPNQIGIVIASGPAQPDLLLEFDSAALRNQAVFALRRIYTCRTQQPMFVRSLKPGENAASSLKLADETKFKPSFEPMFTIGQLVGHLQSAAVRKQ